MFNFTAWTYDMNQYVFQKITAFIRIIKTPGFQQLYRGDSSQQKIYTSCVTQNQIIVLEKNKPLANDLKITFQHKPQTDLTPNLLAWRQEPKRQISKNLDTPKLSASLDTTRGKGEYTVIRF